MVKAVLLKFLSQLSSSHSRFGIPPICIAIQDDTPSVSMLRDMVRKIDGDLSSETDHP